nr:MAG TPA: hypothetical protein [Caudoviricetes sp.]
MILVPHPLFSYISFLVSTILFTSNQSFPPLVMQFTQPYNSRRFLLFYMF